MSVIVLPLLFATCASLGSSFRLVRQARTEADICYKAVPGALLSSTSEPCKCPTGAFVAGENEACPPPGSLRYFNPKKFEGKGCACRAASWLGREKTLELWETAQAVCFDVDSTVITDEGIEVLADHNGKLDEVREWTLRAMGGDVPFRKALEARLTIIQPSAQNVSDVKAAHPLQLTVGFKEMLERVKSRGAEVYLVSGGFRQMIEPVADILGIPYDHIFANNLLFNEDGSFKDFDRNEPTSSEGGKAVVVSNLKAKHGYSPIVMVGDGATDMEARLSADAFIGFGGIAEREKVKIGADLFIRDWNDLIDRV